MEIYSRLAVVWMIFNRENVFHSIAAAQRSSAMSINSMHYCSNLPLIFVPLKKNRRSDSLFLGGGLPNGELSSPGMKKVLLGE